jgi:predicted TIM-barrel fold metal-dependent hydrolase
MDMSKHGQPDLVTQAVKNLGPERVIWGSDWNRPAAKSYGAITMRPMYQHWYSLNTIAEADISEDDRDLILYKNAIRLLKIT